MGTLITDSLRQLTKKKENKLGDLHYRICFDLSGFDVGVEFKGLCYRQMPAHSYSAQFNGSKFLKSGWLFSIIYIYYVYNIYYIRIYYIICIYNIYYIYVYIFHIYSVKKTC